MNSHSKCFFLLPMAISACSASDNAGRGPETTGTGGAGGGGSSTDASNSQNPDGSTTTDAQNPNGAMADGSQGLEASTTDVRNDGTATDDSGSAGVCPTSANLETLLGLTDTSYYANTNVPHGTVTPVYFAWPASNNPAGATIPRTSQQQRSPEVPVGQERMQVYTPPG